MYSGQGSQWAGMGRQLLADEPAFAAAVAALEPDFVEQVEITLARTGLEPSHLVLELTEGSILVDMGAARDAVDALNKLGVRVALDDYGTGYSSLSYLKRFPVETLKIDRSFVEELDQRAENAAIVRAIIGLGESLGLSIIAEGVETFAQVAKLKSLGCFLAQGYLYGKPLPAASLGAFPTDDLTSWQLLVRSAAS